MTTTATKPETTRTTHGDTYRLLTVIDEQKSRQQEAAFLSDAITDFVDRIEFDLRLIKKEDPDKAEAVWKAIRFVKTQIVPVAHERLGVLNKRIEELDDEASAIIARLRGGEDE